MYVPTSIICALVLGLSGCVGGLHDHGVSLPERDGTDIQPVSGRAELPSNSDRYTARNDGDSSGASDSRSGNGWTLGVAADGRRVDDDWCSGLGLESKVPCNPVRTWGVPDCAGTGGNDASGDARPLLVGTGVGNRRGGDSRLVEMEQEPFDSFVNVYTLAFTIVVCCALIIFLTW